MDITPLVSKGQQIIQSYAGGQFRVSGQVYSGPVIVEPAGSVIWDRQDGPLVEADFQPLLAHAEKFDVVLLGMGAQMQFLDADLKAALSEKGLTVDVMDTGAACRTYNVLMAEGRRVVAALLPFVRAGFVS